MKRQIPETLEGIGQMLKGEVRTASKTVNYGPMAMKNNSLAGL